MPFFKIYNEYLSWILTLNYYVSSIMRIFLSKFLHTNYDLNFIWLKISDWFFSKSPYDFEYLEIEVR